MIHPSTHRPGFRPVDRPVELSVTVCFGVRCSLRVFGVLVTGVSCHALLFVRLLDLILSFLFDCPIDDNNNTIILTSCRSQQTGKAFLHWSAHHPRSVASFSCVCVNHCHQRTASRSLATYKQTCSFLISIHY